MILHNIVSNFFFKNAASDHLFLLHFYGPNIVSIKLDDSKAYSVDFERT